MQDWQYPQVLCFGKAVKSLIDLFLTMLLSISVCHVSINQGSDIIVIHLSDTVISLPWLSDDVHVV